jgi:hypothetical protein
MASNRGAGATLAFLAVAGGTTGTAKQCQTFNQGLVTCVLLFYMGSRA